MSGHRVVFPASTKLNKTEIKAFVLKTNQLFAALRKIGIVCRKNFTCCGTCGRAEMLKKYPGKDYVFFHRQEDGRLRHGAEELYMCHNISEANFKPVADILWKFDSVWGHPARLTTVSGKSGQLTKGYWDTATICVWYHPMTEADRCGEIGDHLERAIRLYNIEQAAAAKAAETPTS
jgi:hypothetical protein